MLTWWNGLDTAAQIFFCFAIFFGLMFLWQFIAAILGLGGHGGDLSGGHGDFGGGHGADVASHDLSTGHADLSSGHHVQQAVDASMASFQIFTFRSILAFFTLFTWYAALTLMNKGGLIWAVGFGLLWGCAGMFVVALVFFLMQKLAETGTERIETCLGTTGMVYADIPSGGLGQIRCTVSGCLTVVKARGAGGQAIKAGTPVHILWKIDDTTVEVQPSTETAK